MLTPIPPDAAVEIENKFRAAQTIGQFVDAATHATEALYPNADDSVHVALRKFNAAINYAIVEALGADYPLQPIPDVILLIDDHAAVTGTVAGLLYRQREQLVEATAGQEAN